MRRFRTFLYVLALQTAVFYWMITVPLSNHDVRIRLVPNNSSGRSLIGHLLFGPRSVASRSDDDFASKLSSEEIYNTWLDVDVGSIAEEFKPVLQMEDVENCLKLLHMFVSILERSNLTYMMYGGTLIGSYRHHGLIPWDDDLDVLTDYSQRHMLKSELTSVPGYRLMHEPGMQRWKFFPTSFGRSIPSQYYRWPYVDISFFKQNAVSVWDVDQGYSTAYWWDTYVVFPLKRRPFWNVWMYAPHHTDLFLDQTYDLSNCVSARYNHVQERWNRRELTLQCKLLDTSFPFVHRRKVGGVVEETLHKEGRVVGSVIL